MKIENNKNLEKITLEDFKKYSDDKFNDISIDFFFKFLFLIKKNYRKPKTFLWIEQIH